MEKSSPDYDFSLLLHHVTAAGSQFTAHLPAPTARISRHLQDLVYKQRSQRNHIQVHDRTRDRCVPIQQVRKDNGGETDMIEEMQKGPTRTQRPDENMPTMESCRFEETLYDPSFEHRMLKHRIHPFIRTSTVSLEFAGIFLRSQPISSGSVMWRCNFSKACDCDPGRIVTPCH